MVAELWNGGVVEGNMVDCDGMVELWNGMKWWLVVGDGMVVWRLHQIMSVRIVFGGTCDDFELGLRGSTRGQPPSW